MVVTPSKLFHIPTFLFPISFTPACTKEHKGRTSINRIYGLKGILFGGTSYLKAHPLGSPPYIRTMDMIRTRALGDPSDPKARMVPLYHGGPLCHKRV
ncbi:hypothetical protein E2C01_052180 [Portunus trituberculatus]|uniref:Uncharacterized protein n=1 Tax=Portunus trituberculatus TaxID=210409 RepID=A0A5B7GL84_PORTR|nr:hypothetical protein [Portunus trituberculatus]